jgi:hypothetical protein
MFTFVLTNALAARHLYCGEGDSWRIGVGIAQGESAVHKSQKIFSIKFKGFFTNFSHFRLNYPFQDATLQQTRDRLRLPMSHFYLHKESKK